MVQWRSPRAPGVVGGAFLRGYRPSQLLPSASQAQASHERARRSSPSAHPRRSGMAAPVVHPALAPLVPPPAQAPRRQLPPAADLQVQRGLQKHQVVRSAQSTP